jgi:hypothetical protein
MLQLQDVVVLTTFGDTVASDSVRTQRLEDLRAAFKLLHGVSTKFMTLVRDSRPSARQVLQHISTLKATDVQITAEISLEYKFFEHIMMFMHRHAFEKIAYLQTVVANREETIVELVEKLRRERKVKQLEHERVVESLKQEYAWSLEKMKKETTTEVATEWSKTMKSHGNKHRKAFLQIQSTLFGMMKELNKELVEMEGCCYEDAVEGEFEGTSWAVRRDTVTETKDKLNTEFQASRVVERTTVTGAREDDTSATRQQQQPLHPGRKPTYSAQTPVQEQVGKNLNGNSEHVAPLQQEPEGSNDSEQSNTTDDRGSSKRKGSRMFGTLTRKF